MRFWVCLCAAVSAMLVTGRATVRVIGWEWLALWYLDSPLEEWVGKDMSNMTTIEILNQISFHQLSNSEIETNFQSGKLKILDLMDNHRPTVFFEIKSLFNPNDVKQCDYFDEEQIDNPNRPSTSHLSISSINRRSLSKHGGELLDLMSVLKTKFDIIILTKIGTRNL